MVVARSHCRAPFFRERAARGSVYEATAGSGSDAPSGADALGLLQTEDWAAMTWHLTFSP